MRLRSAYIATVFQMPGRPFWFYQITGADGSRLPRVSTKTTSNRKAKMMTCRSSTFCEELHVPSREAMTILLRRLEIPRLETQRFAFHPPPAAKTLPDQWVGELAALLATRRNPNGIWPCLTPLGWHRSALLALLCCVGKEQSGELDSSPSSRRPTWP